MNGYISSSFLQYFPIFQFLGSFLEAGFNRIASIAQKVKDTAAAISSAIQAIAEGSYNADVTKEVAYFN